MLLSLKASPTKRGKSVRRRLIGVLSLIFLILSLPASAHNYGELVRKSCAVHPDGLYCTYTYERGTVWTIDGKESSYCPNYEQEDEQGSQSTAASTDINSWDPTSKLLLYTFLTLQAADIATTTAAMMTGKGTEANPLFGWVFRTGNPLYLIGILLPVKVAYSWLVVKQTDKYPRARKKILGGLVAGFAALILHNLWVLLL